MMNNVAPNTRFPQAHKLPAHVKARLVASVESALDSNPAAVERAIAVLYARQTASEKATEATLDDNGLGVRHNHGKWLACIAYYGKWLASGRHLTRHHLQFARRIARTYARTQLFELAALKAGLISG
jgi:predicted transcriptional regulator